MKSYALNTGKNLGIFTFNAVCTRSLRSLVHTTALKAKSYFFSLVEQIDISKSYYFNFSITWTFFLVPSWIFLFSFNLVLNKDLIFFWTSVTIYLKIRGLKATAKKLVSLLNSTRAQLLMIFKIKWNKNKMKVVLWIMRLPIKRRIALVTGFKSQSR